jgi:eukaryotic-like serine/threonine-protein kinase
MADRWPQIERVYSAVVTRPASEREDVLASLCGADAVLRAEVESLLAHEEAASAFLETPAFAGAGVTGALAARRAGDVAGDSAGEIAADSGADIASARPLVGRRFGPYTVLAPLGAGAMGEVYRARDDQLRRDVAIKVLPPHVAGDPDRRARFESEARMLAALNHPHIGAIYGLADVDGCRALVLELVEGETLAVRLTKGRLSLATTLAIARQVAEALAAAHERGIIHRDLKPVNIALTPDGVVKVLDFGLAKFGALLPHLSGVQEGSPDAAGAGDADGPSGAVPARLGHRTRDGMILGTPAYMSPEQAAGRPADTRTDLWAFGVVLLEMLTGQPVFTGETDADVLAAVRRAEPDLTMLPADTPALIRRLLRRCLDRDRTRRLDSAAAARLDLDEALTAPLVETPARAAVRSRRALMIVTAALAGVAVPAALVAWIQMRPLPQTPIPSSRFAIVTPAAQPINVASSDRDLALSPDGRQLVYRVGGSTTNGSPLMLRAIDRIDARPLAGPAGAYTPFFSPDNQWIGFFEEAELKKVSIAGGPVVTLGPVRGEPRGASWGDGNTIVFATDDPATGLWRIPADGGEPTALTTPDAARREGDHVFPSVLPGGRGVLFTIATTGEADNAEVAVLDLRTGERRTIVRGGHQADYVPAGSGQGGYLVYAAGGALHAVRFDPLQRAVLGDPVIVVEHMMMKPSGAANYAVSRAGMLVYTPTAAASATPISSLVWVDRKGHEEPINAPEWAYGPPRLSPDGTRVAVGVVEQGNTEVWILDLAGGTPRRLTFNPGMDGLPLWTPDGQRIIFMSDRGGTLNLYSQAADGTGVVDRLTTTGRRQWPTSITSDATHLFGFEDGSPTHAVVLLHMTKTADTARSALGTSTVERLFPGRRGEISPDGRYLAYESAESGRSEVHVRPFPLVNGGRWQISTRGGTRAAWSRNGRELFYIDESMTLIGVPVQTSGPTFRIGGAAKVFDMKYAEPNPSRHYDVSRDGRRFLMLKTSAADPNTTPASIIVVEHWLEESKARVH